MTNQGHTMNKPNAALPPLKWTAVATTHGKNTCIPEASGVYAYGEITRVAGLPVSTKWVYVGKAINLRQRIGNGHDARWERNDALREWLSAGKTAVELWFAQVPREELDRVERRLVGAAQPVFNRNLKG